MEGFVLARIAAGASATTINRSLEVARTILNRAARAYRDDEGNPWLNAVPPLIAMLAESPRSPYPITWNEQDRLFRRLPGHLATMALFAVNTGLRDSNLCGLQWMWEVSVSETGETTAQRRKRLEELLDKRRSLGDAIKNVTGLGAEHFQSTAPQAHPGFIPPDAVRPLTV